MNTEAALSRIEDVDIAKAVLDLGKVDILIQSSIAMMTQANVLNRDMILRLIS
jgi:flagellin-like hook-associated protein FlgL